jgi:ferredoxin
MSTQDPRLHSPAAERNKGPILTELLRRLPAQGRALEVASGSGQHVVHFAAAMPGWQWQPSEAAPGPLASIDARRSDAGLRNIAAPRPLDLLDPRSAWPEGPFDLVLAINLLHIAPWSVCAALMQGAAARLAPGGRLVTYGPYRVEGVELGAGNQAFDADLKARDPAWGLRTLGEVGAAAAAAGLALGERVAMPADNLLLLFQHAETAPVHQARLEPAGWTFDAPGGQGLLASALAAGIRLPHACRNGSCRACLCRLREGRVRYAVDWPGLAADERADGWTLPCVALPDTDVVLEAPAARRPGRGDAN